MDQLELREIFPASAPDNFYMEYVIAYLYNNEYCSQITHTRNTIVLCLSAIWIIGAKT